KFTPAKGATNPSARAAAGNAMKPVRTNNPAANRLICLSWIERSHRDLLQPPCHPPGRVYPGSRVPRVAITTITQQMRQKLRSRGRALEQFPCTGDVPLFCPDISDRQPQGVSAIELRVG